MLGEISGSHQGTGRMSARAAKVAAQDARRDLLARLRCERPLTPDERAEEERLERRLAARIWERQQVEAEAHLAQKLEQEEG